MAQAAKLSKLRDERKKQMALYKSLPDQRDKAAQEIAVRIHAIVKNIAKIQADAQKSGGTSIWVWVAGTVFAGSLAWAFAYLGGLSSL